MLVVVAEQVGLVDLPLCQVDYNVQEVLVELVVNQQVILQQVQLVLLIEVVVAVLLVILVQHLQL